MNRKDFTANIENIISIDISDESKADIEWYEEETKLKRIPWFNPIKSEVTEPGHYRMYWDDRFKTLQAAIDYHTRNGRDYLKIVKTGELNEGPDGTAFNKASVKMTLVGGKYTGEHSTYFDSYSEAINWVKELQESNINKFTKLINN